MYMGYAKQMKSHEARVYKCKGFTLIELVIVVAIVGILAAVAYPSYVEQVRKGKRADAQSALMDAVNRQEQYFLDNKTYTTDMKALGYSADPVPTPDGDYSIDAVAGTCGDIAACYTLTAARVAGGAMMSDNLCKDLTITSTGVKSATGSSANKVDDCW